MQAASSKTKLTQSIISRVLFKHALPGLYLKINLRLRYRKIFVSSFGKMSAGYVGSYFTFKLKIAFKCLISDTPPYYVKKPVSFHGQFQLAFVVDRFERLR